MNRIHKIATAAAWGVMITVPLASLATAKPPAVTLEKIPTAPCKFEDGPAPCFWDAGARGNGKGHSFWIDRRGNIHYLDPNFKSGR